MFKFIILILFMILYLIISILFFPLIFLFKGEKRKQYVHNRVRRFGKTMFYLTGSKIEIQGQENIPQGPALFVGNHQSNFDIPVFLGFINKNVGFIAKKETEKIPLLSTWMKLIGCQFIDRSSPRAAVQTINDGAENLKNGSSLCIFPEGTRTPDREIHEFKAGSLKLATKAEVPVIPVSINGTYDMMNKHSLKVHKANVKVIVGKPIYINEDNKKTKILTQQVEKVVKENYEKIR